MSTKRKRNDYDIEMKRELIYHHKKNPNLSHADLKIYFDEKWKTNIGKSTIGDILNSQDKYLSMDSIRSPGAKRLRWGEYPNLEKCLYMYIWLMDKVKNKISISDEILISQAKMFGADLGVSD